VIVNIEAARAAGGVYCCSSMSFEPPENVVKYPYDIAKIFPGDDAASVRLPRRQAGSSPQDLTLTLLADYTTRTRAWLPSGAIVALLVESGVTPAGARTAISRLARRQVLERRQQGRFSSYRLTDAVAGHLSAGGVRIASYGDGTETWDGLWTVFAFSMPQDEGKSRRSLRRALQWLGFAPLYDALWISPHELDAGAREDLKAESPRAWTVFRARHQELAVGGEREPIDAWDIPAIVEQYAAFIRHWTGLLPRVRAGAFSGVEAVRLRTEVMDTYRRFCTIDPQLPTALLPAGWPRGSAREVFTAVYDGMADVAERYVRTTAGIHAPDAPPEIHANTVADLLAGAGQRLTSPSPIR
jgi:phenylacetic acid degradation operon negative regulatory protein